MKYLKQWKWQLVVAAPFLPWLYIWYLNFIYQYGLFLGWDSVASAMATFFLISGATAVFVAGYVHIHDS